MRSLGLLLVAALLGLGALLWLLRSAPLTPLDSAGPESMAESAKLAEAVTSLGARSVADPLPRAPDASPHHGIAGRVVYPDGSPVGEGFDVLAFLEGIEPPVTSARATTDAQGAFLLPDSLAEGAFVLDAAGHGWGTERRTPLDPEKALELPAIELTVQPLYAALLQARTDGPNGARGSFLGCAELQVLPMVARQVENLALQHWHGTPGWDLLVYTPAKVGDTPDSLPGQIICRGLDRPQPTGHPLFVPRWDVESVVRLDSTPCWSQGPFANLEVSISGGVGWELLDPEYPLATLELGSESGQILRAPLTVAQWTTGFAEFPVPQGDYKWWLAANGSPRKQLAAGNVEVLHGAGQIAVALSGFGALVLEVETSDGTPYSGSLDCLLLLVMEESQRFLPDGRETTYLAGIRSERAWTKPPYVAPFLDPGEYLATQNLRKASGAPFGFGRERVPVVAGKLTTFALKLEPATGRK